MSTRDMTRRELLQRTATGAALAGLPAWYATEALAADTERAAERPADYCANDTIQIAVIGPGGSKGGFRQGLGVTRGIARKQGVRCIAVCDVDKTHAAEAGRAFGPETKVYHDFRELLDNKDVDAVVIGTPDHWHAIIAIAALKAGKHVYCEKPLTLFIAEGRAIANAAKRAKKAFQTGSQQRSDARFRLACEAVRNGRIGKVRRVEARLPNGSRGGPFAVSAPPADFDWDFWQGPAQATEYIKERTHGSFRHWYEYSGGMMTDWGAHHLDITQWGLGMDGSGPISVEATGLLPAGPRSYNALVDFEVTYGYPGDITVVAMSKGENGVRFEGDRGWVFVSRGRIEASDPAILETPFSGSDLRLYASNDHFQNFVDCVRDGKDTICTAEIGHRSATVCHLGNISMRLGGRKLAWDPAKERFATDEEANQMVSRPYRKPWKLG